MRRLWTASLVGVLSLLFTSVAPAAAQTMVAVVTDPEGVNLRGGPGTQYASLAVIPKGTELTILGDKYDQDWLPTSFAGMRGFVHEQFVDLRPVVQPGGGGPMPPQTRPLASPTPSPTPTAMQTLTPTPAVLSPLRVVPVDGLNMRAGPGTDQKILAVIPKDTRLTPLVRSADGKWYLVIFNGQQGWIDGQYTVPWEDRPTAPATPAAKYVWPVTGRSITTYYGWGHPGIDVDQFPAGGNPVVAVADGTVSFAGGNPCCSYGLHVIIDHAEGVSTLSAHLMSVEVREGEAVKQGQRLGLSGNTGRSTGAHLHFELKVGGGAVDPMGYLGR